MHATTLQCKLPLTALKKGSDPFGTVKDCVFPSDVAASEGVRPLFQRAARPYSMTERLENPLSRLRTFAIAAVAALAIFTPLRAQEEEKPVDEKEKEATRKLLAKAEDEYRSFFKRPETTFEFWAAIKFELDV